MFSKLFFINLVVIVAKAKFNIIPKTQDVPYGVRCIDTILNNIFRENNYTHAILKYGIKTSITSFSTVTINNLDDIKSWPQFLFKAYLIREELAETESLLKKLFKLKVLWPRSWYIFFSNFNSTSNFSFFTKFYIANVFAINTNLDIFTIDPYQYENANQPENQPIQIGSCKEIHKIEIHNYISKYPQKWRNTTVREYFRLLVPFTKSSFDGLEDKLFDLFKERLEFKNVRRNVPAETVSAKLFANEEACKKALQEKRLDIFGGLFNLRSDDSPMDYDITPSYFLKTVVWMTPNGPPVSAWWRIERIFPYEFYVGWILILVILSLLAKYFYGTSINLILSMAFEILIEYPVIHRTHLKSLSAKLSAGAWILAMLTISAVFKNSLLVITATTVRKHNLESLEDILRSDLKVAGSPSKYMKEIYSIRKPGDITINFDKMERCNHEECLNRTAFKKDTAVLTEKSRTLYHYIPLWFRDDNGDSIVHLGSEIVLSETIHLIFSKGYPLFRSCSNIILRASNSGWFQKQLDSLERATDIKMIKIDTKTKSISLKSISFIFYIWACGVILALIIFCVELIIANVKTIICRRST